MAGNTEDVEPKFTITGSRRPRPSLLGPTAQPPGSPPPEDAWRARLDGSLRIASAGLMTDVITEVARRGVLTAPLGQTLSSQATELSLRTILATHLTWKVVAQIAARRLDAWTRRWEVEEQEFQPADLARSIDALADLAADEASADPTIGVPAMVRAEVIELVLGHIEAAMPMAKADTCMTYLEKVIPGLVNLAEQLEQQMKPQPVTSSTADWLGRIRDDVRAAARSLLEEFAVLVARRRSEDPQVVRTRMLAPNLVDQAVDLVDLELIFRHLPDLLPGERTPLQSRRTLLDEVEGKPLAELYLSVEIDLAVDAIVRREGQATSSPIGRTAALDRVIAHVYERLPQARASVLQRYVDDFNKR